MYQNLADNNPLITKYNGYTKENNKVPFQNNELINNNVHIKNNLNNLVRNYKSSPKKINKIQKINEMKKKDYNIIEDILKPQKIKENNKDVNINYNVRKELQENAKNGKIDIKITNEPYKNIIKDKIITKRVEDIRPEDLIIYKTNKLIDADINIFKNNLELKRCEEENINNDLNIEFNIKNYDKHKQNFEYKETFIKNLTYTEKTFDENKSDYISFYKKKQKEAEEGKKLCDQILRNIDNDIINKSELPTENTIESNFNINNILDNM